MSTGSSFNVVSRFNACIGSADLDGLASLMSEDHRFVDTSGTVLQGKAMVVKAWRRFFTAFPGYRNVLLEHSECGESVVVQGMSEVSDSRLNGPALWKAVVRDGLVAEWWVFSDTAANRSALGLHGSAASDA